MQRPFLKSILGLLAHFPQPEVHDAVHQATAGGANLFMVFLTLVEAAFGVPDIASLIAKLLSLIPKAPPVINHG